MKTKKKWAVPNWDSKQLFSECETTSVIDVKDDEHSLKINLYTVTGKTTPNLQSRLNYL